MSTILNSHPVFEDNQVLTSSQLNNLAGYLDQQNRLTRVKLIGMGIVCGQEISYNSQVTPNELTISQGVAITSEGFLINVSDCVTTQYRPYLLPSGVTYTPFQNENLEQDVELYELLTADVVPELGEDPFVELDADATSGFMDDKVVLLFLECLDKDLKSCIGKACDEIGIDRLFTQRKLLISITDLQKVLVRTGNNLGGGLYPDQSLLPDITMRRVRFDPLDAHSNEYTFFGAHYPERYTDIQSVLFSALEDTYDVFEPILSPIYGGVNPFGMSIAGLINDWNELSIGSSTNGVSFLGIQYFYDFLKDLILAYNEFRDCALELMSECCPNMDRFPKHIMLGEAIPVGNCEASEFRQVFASSPLFGDQKELLQKTIMLHKRMAIMVRKFDLERVHNPAVIADPATPDSVILSTPSCEKKSLLSDRAIPYYYDIHSNESEFNLGKLENSWDYRLLKKCADQTNPPVLSYHNQDVNEFVDQGPIQSPLWYTLDPFNFLRIEGHIGMDIVTAENRIQQLKDRFDLPFDVVSLRLQGDTPLDDIMERCGFDDLRSEYLVCREEFICTVQGIFDRIATLEGDNIVLKGSPDLIIALLTDTVAPGKITTGQSSEATPEASRELREGIGTRIQAPVFTQTLDQALADLLNDLTQFALRMQRLIGLLPYELKEFNFGLEEIPGTTDPTQSFILTYTEAVQFAINSKVCFNALVDQVIHSTKTKSTDELYLMLSLYASEAIDLLNDFIGSCHFEKFKVIDAICQYRINYLTENDQTKFSNFITRNPGIDHMAGVPMGGTFILLYAGDNLSINQNSVDEVRSQSKELRKLIKRRDELLAKGSITRLEAIELESLQRKIFELTQTEDAIAGGVIPNQAIGITEGQIIADFALPYYCCTDPECLEVPFPSEAELNLPLIAMPAFVEFDPGTYAFPHDQSESTYMQTTVGIDVVSNLQYEKATYSDDQIRLRIVQPNGNFKTPADPVADNGAEAIGQSVILDSLKVAHGTVRAIYNSPGSSPAMSFQYIPDAGYVGVDTFNFLFDIVDREGGTVIKRSTCAMVTVHIHNAPLTEEEQAVIDSGIEEAPGGAQTS